MAWQSAEILDLLLAGAGKFARLGGAGAKAVAGGDNAPATAASPKDTVFGDGTAKLYHFRRAPTDRAVPLSSALPQHAPVLVVPSLINRWYIVDLRPGSSLIEALVRQGLDVWCLDWGVPEDEDRHLTWDDIVARLRRMVRKVLRETGQPRVSLLGYCIGATLCGVHAALQPDTVASLINLAGPFDFAKIGKLGHMTDPRWFDGAAMASAGNMSAKSMQSGFQALRPTAEIAKKVNMLHKMHDVRAMAAFRALDGWASANIAFPAAAYATWITEFYQENRLIQGNHASCGRPVELQQITCPLLTITTARDEICPPEAALGLDLRAGSKDKTVVSVPGGHVGAVVGRTASTHLYPAIAGWLKEKT